MLTFVRVSLSVSLLFAAAGSALAQSSDLPRTPRQEGWKVAIYPVLAWIPTHIGLDVNVPPFEGGGGVTGGQGVEILDPRFDGAFVGGLSLARGAWRIDADGVFAAIGGDRAELPRLTVDANLIYGHASVGRSIYKDLYVTAGVRRLALKYDITLVNFDTFTRKPGVWDPLVGLGWHRVGDTLELHASVEGGGFRVGADYDVGASFRVDWKPLRHFGLVGGYSGMIFKVSQDIRSRTLVAKQSLHGPVAGIGLYF